MKTISLDEFRGLYGQLEKAADPLAQDWDRSIFLALCNHVQAKTVVEFGVHVGRMAKFVLDRSKTVERYVGIDVPAGFKTDDRAHQFLVPAKAGEMVAGDSRFLLICAENGTAGLSSLQIPRANAVHIDADHSYEGVRRDSELAFAVIEAGGVIVWGDYRNLAARGVTKYLDEIADGTGIINVENTWMCYLMVG